jgi:hypothetical protein
MDPSLIEIISEAVGSARAAGLEVQEQRQAAVRVLIEIVPSLSTGIAELIVDQLFPIVADRVVAA